MKKTIGFLIFINWFCFIHAQIHIDSILQFNKSLNSSYKTQNSYRIKAIVETEYANGNITFIDSLEVFYSGGRYGEFNENWEYDSIYAYHGSDSNLALFGRLVQIFNSDNLITQWKQEYIQSGSWTTGFVKDQTYNSNNLLHTETLKHWNSTYQTWYIMHHIINTYDINNNIYISTSQKEFSGTLVDDKRTLFIYNPDSTLDHVLYQLKNNTTWKDERKTEYSYGTGNSVTSIGMKFINNNWINEGRVTSVYTPNNNLLEETSEYWNGNNWVNNFRYTYFYNTTHLLDSLHIEKYINGAWSIIKKETYVYNTNDLVELITRSSFVNNTWQVDETQRFYYESYLNIIVGNDFLVKIFPNPFDETLMIDVDHRKNISEIIIYDMVGRIIYTEEYKSNGNNPWVIQTSFLPSGLYFYKIIGDNFSQSGKLIKR